jgi:hypothetical protein
MDAEASVQVVSKIVSKPASKPVSSPMRPDEKPAPTACVRMCATECCPIRNDLEPEANGATSIGNVPVDCRYLSSIQRRRIRALHSPAINQRAKIKPD